VILPIIRCITLNLPKGSYMNKRDIYNIAILKLFNSKSISESQAMSMLKIDKRSERTRNKYIKQLIKWIRDEQLYLANEEKLHGTSNEEIINQETQE
jgi:hypothetical protein